VSRPEEARDRVIGVVFDAKANRAGRPPRSTEPATSRVTIRFTSAELAALDAARGDDSRAGYVRALIAKATS